MKTGYCFLAVFVLCGVCAADDTDQASIRKLVPTASAMSLTDWDQLATSASPSMKDIESKSLTLTLMALKITTDKERTAEFQYVGDRQPKPNELAQEMAKHVRGRGRFRVALGPITLVHADRITDFTCQVEGDTAKGVVTFKVPKLYEGKVNYVAKRVQNKWQIDEFAMPACKVQIVRGDQGIWKQAESKGDQ